MTRLSSVSLPLTRKAGAGVDLRWARGLMTLCCVMFPQGSMQLCGWGIDGCLDETRSLFFRISFSKGFT